MKLLAIDPSINDCGICVFNNNNIITYILIHPKKLKIKNKNKGIWLLKAESVCNQIKNIITVHKIDQIVLEIPEYWRGNIGFAARETGTIWKLMFLCGKLSTLVKTRCVTPSEWKGQLSKEQVKNRLQKYYKDTLNLSKVNHNVVDAIGIGYWYIYERKVIYK